MGQKVGGYRRNVPYGEETVRVSRGKETREKSWRFEVNPKGRVGWNRGTAGRTEKEYGESVSDARRLRKEVEEVRKGFGCEMNGLGRKGRKTRGYQVYGEYTYPDGNERRKPVERGEGREKTEGGEKKEGKVKGGKKKRNLKKGYGERELRVGRERVRRKYEKRRKAKIERKRTNLKERRKEKGLEGEKKERKLVLGQTSKRVKSTERCEAVTRSGILPTGQRRTNLRVRELENGLNHMEVMRNMENRRNHHAKSSQYGRKKRDRERKKGEKYGYYGYQVVVKGPLGGARRTMTYEIQNGTVPRGTKKARRRTNFEHAKTKIGTIGVKVTYCYGRG